MSWDIQFTNKSSKQARDLDEQILLVLQLLVNDLRIKGPIPGRNWHNYGKLRGPKQEDKRHCHLVKGKPTYVCCWEVFKVEHVIEVYYVGTHEKAPY
ncbi:MAG: cytotoxic translational repressor of toxin-antitoxin stability system [Gammaproteobacteria bacterium]|jgi:mRNA-degrading endonuclease RelE of RelBE toxin-antitoxin system